MEFRGGQAGPPTGKEAQDLLELRAELLRKKQKLDAMMRKGATVRPRADPPPLLARMPFVFLFFFRQQDNFEYGNLFLTPPLTLPHMRRPS
jgi:hypothetical protein